MPKFYKKLLIQILIESFDFIIFFIKTYDYFLIYEIFTKSTKE